MNQCQFMPKHNGKPVCAAKDICNDRMLCIKPKVEFPIIKDWKFVTKEEKQALREKVSQ